MKIVTIAAYDSLQRASMVRDILEDEGIMARLAGGSTAEVLSYMALGAGMTNEILIREADRERATQIIEQLDAEWIAPSMADPMQAEAEEEDAAESDADDEVAPGQPASASAFRAFLAAWICASILPVGFSLLPMDTPARSGSNRVLSSVLAAIGICAAYWIFRIFLGHRRRALAGGDLGLGGQMALFLSWMVLAGALALCFLIGM